MKQSMTANTHTHQQTRLSVGKRLFRALILGSASAVLSLPMTTTTGSLAAFAGAMLAVLVFDSLPSSARILRLRTYVLLLLAALVIACGQWLASLLVHTSTPTNSLGALSSFQLGQLSFWLFLSASCVGAIRLLSRRFSWGAALELLYVAAAFVLTLSAHQNGMIDRPYFLGDFALIRGLDPSYLFMATGVVAVLVLTLLLMLEQPLRRIPYHLAALALLCLSLLVYISLMGMPSPPLTDDLGLTGQSQNGRSNQPENPFRDGDNNADNKETPVAIVLFRDDYEPQSGAYYFRESAYSEFNGQLLWTADTPGMDPDLVREFPVQSTSVSNEIPALDKRRSVTTTIGLLTPHRSPFGLDAPVRFENTPNPNSMRFRQTYTVESMVPEFEFPDLIGRNAGSPSWSISQWQKYLELPDDPRYQEKAESLIANIRQEFADDPYAKALAVKAWLDDNGIYSLANEHAYASDPAASFLFGDMTGYCVHFAYSATYLYRSLGIPARVGVGYSVPASNRAGGSALLIQAIHGHAWPEIYLDGLGWVIVDPAPARTLVDMSTEPQDTLQQMLGDMLRDDASFDAFVASQESDWSLNPVALLRPLLAIILCLLVAAWLLRLYRAYCATWAPASEQYRLQYRAALDTLSAAGIYRHYGESREAFARRQGKQYPALISLTQAHLQQSPGYACRPGATIAIGNSNSAVTDQPWQQWRQQLAQEITRALPWWRRAVAWLHPAPWLRSH
jgi:transglutaminase-like putative cysteine protease